MSTVKEASTKTTLFDSLLNKPSVLRAKPASGTAVSAENDLPPIFDLEEPVSPSAPASKTAMRSLIPQPTKALADSQVKPTEAAYSYAGAKARMNLHWEGVDAAHAMPANVIAENENQKAVRNAKAQAQRLSDASRRPQLDSRAQNIIASLPEAIRPIETSTNFPHIMNLIGMSWADPKDFVKTLDNLLIDDRGTRQGFPFAVIVELTELREHYFAAVRPECRQMWDRL